MQINSATAMGIVTAGVTSSSSASKPAYDQVVMSNSADSFSSLVNEASQYPDVRSEVVDAYKARVNSGHYPSQDVIEGLTKLMGGKFAAMANSGSSSNGSSSSDTSSASTDSLS